MKTEDLIKQAESGIRQAIKDYGKHTSRQAVIEDMSEAFIQRLARDSVLAKQELRGIFSRSSTWDEHLDAFVIDATKTHEPNMERIAELSREILPADRELAGVVRFFSHEPISLRGGGDYSFSERQADLDAITRISPKAYAPNKKLSRIFKAVCASLGIIDETAGSRFQKLYAQLADELSTQQVRFKLYVSLNPAHFLTMSNPKEDNRGTMLTSCHSLNSTQYGYNCGCVGYARDHTSFIAFTVADPNSPETFFNRKTTRQIFAYNANDDVLLQSRLYNTQGGTAGTQEEMRLYRDLIQRELSALEQKDNLWITIPSYSQDAEQIIHADDEFGGYEDWVYQSFGGRLCFRKASANRYKELSIGAAGLCVICADQIESGMYCKGCNSSCYCEWCEEYFSEGLNTAYNSYGEEIEVCDYCLSEHFICCDRCDRYLPDECFECINGSNICKDCIDEYYDTCEYCGSYALSDELTTVNDENGEELLVCDSCKEDRFALCVRCSMGHPKDLIKTVFDRYNLPRRICANCMSYYSVCPACQCVVEITSDDKCPHCGSEEVSAIC